MHSNSDFVVEQFGENEVITLPSGRKMPVISGGRTNDPTVDSPQGAQGGQTRTISQDDLVALIQKQEKIIENLQQQVQQQKGQFDELVEAIAEAVGNEDEEQPNEDEEEYEEEPEPEPVASRRPQQNAAENEELAQLRRQITKMNKQMEEMQNLIHEREMIAEQERELRLATERDNLLTQALQEAGVLPSAMDAALKLFRDNIAYDDERDEFFFIEDKSGVKLPISEGIKDNLPDYLKATQAKHGGSGSRGSQTNTMLEQARQQLSRLQEQARKSGNDADIAAYHNAKKKVLELEQSRQPTATSGGGTPRSATTTGRERAPQQREPVGVSQDDF